MNERPYCQLCQAELVGNHHPSVLLVAHYIHSCPEFDGTRDRRTVARRQKVSS